jgi:hypothetical protein
MDNDKYMLMAMSVSVDPITGYWFESAMLDPFRIKYIHAWEGNGNINFKISEKLQPFLFEILKLSDAYKYYNNND